MVLAAQYAVPVLSFEQILQDETISAVAIVTPAITHYELAKRALEAGKHVFVEKPITLNLDHARSLCKIAQSMQRQLMVGHLLHYHPAFIKLKELVHTGSLGQIQYIYAHRLDLGKIYTQKDVLWNMAPHDLSMILALTNASPISTTAAISCNIRDNLADFATINMSFASGAKAHIFVSCLNPFKEQKLTVICKNFMAVFDDTSLEWNKKLAIYDYKIEMKQDSIVTVKGAPEFVEIEQAEPLKNECQHFINCILGNRTPITDGQEALRVMETLVQARSMAYSGENLLVS